MKETHEEYLETLLQVMQCSVCIINVNYEVIEFHLSLWQELYLLVGPSSLVSLFCRLSDLKKDG